MNVMELNVWNRLTPKYSIIGKKNGQENKIFNFEPELLLQFHFSMEPPTCLFYYISQKLLHR